MKTGQNTSHAVMQQRSEAHDSLDDFPTPPWAGRALVEHVIRPALPSGRDLQRETVWEPACNRGYLARPLGEYFGRVYASDIHDYGWLGHDGTRDFLYPLEPPFPRPDWIITNPPFRLAKLFLFRAFELGVPNIALIVRTGWLEGVDRFNTVFRSRPPSIVAQFAERVPMVKGRYDPEASSATSYCWIVWMKDYPRGTKLQWIPPCRKALEKPTDHHQ